MQFKYTATNNQGKTLSGIINAGNETLARTQLNNLGFSILELKAITDDVISPKPKSEKLEKFEFEALDKNGKKIAGTIPAKDPVLAYKRLFEEYHFTIQQLHPFNPTSAFQAVSLQEIQTQYQQQNGTNPAGTNEVQSAQSAVETPEFLMQKTTLVQQVEETLQRIKLLLAKFETKIQPEKRAQIEGYIDKLMRIKTSNNLDYIKHTCKDLLDKIQEEELFFQGMDHGEERQSFLLESQKMMYSLDRAATKKPETQGQFQDAFHGLGEKLKDSKLNFLKEWMESLEKKWKPSPELAALQSQLKTLKRQEWDGVMLVLKSPKETRPAQWENLKSIHQQVKILKEALKTTQKTQKQKNELFQKEKKIVWLEEFNAFTGWLLGFYLIYYFLGYYVTQGNLDLAPFLGIPFSLEDSVLFKYLLVLVFLMHSASSLKINFFLRNTFATISLPIASFVIMLLTLFNF